MKYLNTLKKATPLLLLPVMGSAMATDVTVPLNFTTLPAISIAPITPMDFGSVLSLTLADTCTMSTSAGTLLTPSQEGADSTDSVIFNTTTAAQNSTGQLSGNCTGGADGQVGIYEITSFANADITVTTTAGTATDISFAPSGYVTDLASETTAGVFSRESLSVGVDADVNASASLTAYSQAGTNRVIVGGTITNFGSLTAGQAYATDFNIDVVYQ